MSWLGNCCRLVPRGASLLAASRHVPSALRCTRSRLATQVTRELERRDPAIGWWLAGCSGMVFGAVVLGGVTRLTESGLSMVEWRLIADMRGPKDDAEWAEQFEKYKQFPEFSYKSSFEEMTLAEFKFIYGMEWSHRMWGRVTGMVFLLPAAYFLARGRLSSGMKKRVAAMGGLLGFQGALGWYMVKSGLKQGPDVPRVSQYRLCAHLGTALLLHCGLLWNSLTHLLPPQAHKLTFRSGLLHPLLILPIFTTALTGAFVAGLDAGLTYNSWPKMADRWIPSDLFALTPLWRNFTENATTVQFIHRHMGELSLAAVTGTWLSLRKLPLPPRARLACNILLFCGWAQVALGISTLLMMVPTHLAATHQAGSVTLLSAAIWLTHELRRIPK